MKIAIFLTSLLASASAFVPTKSFGVARSQLFAEEESEAAEWSGAESFSALTKGVDTVFSLEDIAKILPHRYPFALVDKVIEYEAGKVCDTSSKLNVVVAIDWMLFLLIVFLCGTACCRC